MNAILLMLRNRIRHSAISCEVKSPIFRSPNAAVAFEEVAELLDRHRLHVVLREIGLDEFAEVNSFHESTSSHQDLPQRVLYRP